MKCENCGSDRTYEALKGQHKGLYCKDCGQWQKWVQQDDLGKSVVFCGKYKGKRLDDISLRSLDSYLAWIEGIKSPGEALLKQSKIFARYLAQEEVARELEVEIAERGMVWSKQ